MEDGRWRMKDEGRRMEDEEKNIFYVENAYICIYMLLRMAFSPSMGVNKIIFFVYDSYFLYLDNLFTKTK